MLFLVCHSCKVGLRISPGEPGELEALLDVDPGNPGASRYDCFRCEKRVAELSEGPPADIELFDVNPNEAFAAINGLGLPGEQDCGAAAVSQLFLNKKVAKVHTRMIRNSHRCILDWIEFEDGTRAYFGASAMGATVFRVAPRHSYVKEAEGG